MKNKIITIVFSVLFLLTKIASPAEEIEPKKIGTLSQAIESDQSAEEIKKLIDHKADVNEQCGPFKDTALILATVHGKKEIVKLLLEKKADVTKKDKFKNPALVYAQMNRFNDIAELLREFTDTSGDEPQEEFEITITPPSQD